MKKCRKCNTVKPIVEFSKSAANKDGLQHFCKACQKEYRVQNKERLKEYQAEYYTANKDNIASRVKEYRESNSEKYKSQRAEYRAKNSNWLPEYNRKYREENAERLSMLREDWHKRNPTWWRDYKMKNKEKIKASQDTYNSSPAGRANNVNGRCNRIGMEGRITGKDIAKLLKSQGGACRYCSVKFTENQVYSVDHKTPMRWGGDNTASNIQLLCEPCNVDKTTIPYRMYEELIGFNGD